MRNGLRFLVAILALAATFAAEGASLVTTSSAPNAMPSASKYVTHWASGHYWIALRKETPTQKLALFSSTDGITWIETDVIFQTFYPDDFEWAVRYSGDTIVAFGHNDGDDIRYYRKGTLEPTGTVSWNTTPEIPATVVADATNQELNAGIVNGKPVMWRAGDTNADNGVLTIGDRLDAPVSWTDYPAPPLAGTTLGRFSAGAVLPLGGADRNDLIVLRSTTTDLYTPGAHRLVALKFDASASAFDPAWYDVSTLGGTLVEDMTTEVRVMLDGSAHQRFTAVRAANGRLHAVYVNRNSKAVHYVKEPGFNDTWSRISTDITGASTTSKAALGAIEHGALLLYYERGDRRIWTRRFDGKVWEPENLLYDSGGTDINDAIGPIESITECASGVTFSEGVLSPVNLYFSRSGQTCDVEAFTATSTSGQNRLQWVNPVGPYNHTRIMARDDGNVPTGPNDVAARLVCDDFGTAGDKAACDDPFLIDTTTYAYVAFVNDGTSYSMGIPVEGRPFDNSGSVKWAFSTGATTMAPPGLKFNGVSRFVYAVSDNVVHAVDGSDTGGEWASSWKPLPIGAAAQSRLPLLGFPVGNAANGVALVGAQDGYVYAVDNESGSLEWQSARLGEMIQGAPGGIFSAFGAPFDLVIAMTRNSSPPNRVYALKIFENGEVAWEFDNSIGAGGYGGTIGMINAAPTVSYTDVAGKRLMYFGSHAGSSPFTVWCLRFDGGSVAAEWASSLPGVTKGADVEGSPILYNNTVYVGTAGGELVALDPAANGAVKWIYDANDGPIKGYVFPRFWKNEVFFSTSSKVHLLRDDGTGYTVMPSWPVSSIPNPSTPLYLSWVDELVVGAGDGHLYRTPVGSPSPLKVQLGDGSAGAGTPSLNILDRLIYVGTVSGIIYAIHYPF